MPRGQYLIGDRFPILTYGSTPKFHPDVWHFTLGGLVEKPLKFTWEERNELPKAEAKADMHCVTSWSKLDNIWMGVQAKYLLELAKPKPAAKFFFVFCDGGYTTNAPVEELYEEDALRHPPQPQAFGAGARLSSTAGYSAPLRLEECQVGAGDRAYRRGQAGLLGAERLPHLR